MARNERETATGTEWMWQEKTKMMWRRGMIMAGKNENCHERSMQKKLYDIASFQAKTKDKHFPTMLVSFLQD